MIAAKILDGGKVLTHNKPSDKIHILTGEPIKVGDPVIKLFDEKVWNNIQTLLKNQVEFVCNMDAPAPAPIAFTGPVEVVEPEHEIIVEAPAMEAPAEPTTVQRRQYRKHR